MAAIFALGLFALFVPVASALDRSQGISVHFIPQRANLAGGTLSGFFIDSVPGMKRNVARPVIRNAAALLGYVRAQDQGVRWNGLWIVMKDRDQYSREELSILEEVKTMCRDENIPLFLCRDSELPNGWVREN
jgi:hypothetical protein